MDANAPCATDASALVACAPVRRAPLDRGLAEIARQASPSRTVRATAEVHARLMAATGRGLPLEERTAARWTRATLDRAGGAAVASVHAALTCAAAPGRCAQEATFPSPEGAATVDAADALDVEAHEAQVRDRSAAPRPPFAPVRATSALRATVGLRPRLREEDATLIAGWTGWATLHARHGARVTLVAGGDVATADPVAVRLDLHLPVGAHAWLGAAVTPALAGDDEARWALQTGRRLPLGGTLVVRMEDPSPARGDAVWTLLIRR